ncbi:MAG: BTAD domain-containing putative transcriptional regulator, partial [Longimicrobiales bacterium]
MNLEIETLGQVRVLLDGQVLPGLPPQRIRCALLIFLAVSRTTSRDRVLGTFWPDRPQEKARHALSQTLYELRRALGEDWLAATGDTLTTTSAARTDAGEFEAQVAQGQYERALERYRGPFLDGFVVPESHEFEDWIDQQRLRLSRLHRKARREAIRARKASGDVAGAATLARQWVELDPEEDEAQHSFIELIAASGQRTDALRQYEQYRDRLKASDLEPLPETEQLIARIREGEAGAVAPLETSARLATRGSASSEASREPDGAGSGAAGPPASPSLPSDSSVGWRRSLHIRGLARKTAASVLLLAATVLVVAIYDSDDDGGLTVAIAPLTFGAPGTRAVETALMQAIGLLPGVSSWVDSSAASSGREQTALRAARSASARYLVTVSILRDPAGDLLTLDLHTVADARSVRLANSRLLAGNALDSVAYDLVRALGRASNYRRYVFDQIAATSATAFALLLRAQEEFRASQIDAAVGTLRRAAEVDPGLALAHHRLSVAEAWTPRHDYAASLGVIDSALAHVRSFTPLELRLLSARRFAALRHADSSIAAYQRIVPDRGQLIEAQLGLAEAILHYGALADRDPVESFVHFERVLALDSAFAPIDGHLIDLAVLRGDGPAARRFLARWPTDDGNDDGRFTRQAEIALRFGTRAEREAMLDSLRTANRRVLGLLAAFYARNALDLELVDSVGRFMTAPERTADERIRGAQYRLVALLAQDRTAEALATWMQHAGQAEFDAWLIHACLAGYPVGGAARRMWDWAERRAARGDLPKFKATTDLEPDVAGF